MDNNSHDQNKNEVKKPIASSFGSFLLIVVVLGIIGFVTILPGKNNHITEFPSLERILNRELLFMGVPIILGIILWMRNKTKSHSNL